MSKLQKIIAAILAILGIGGGVAYSQLGSTSGIPSGVLCATNSVSTSTNQVLTPGTGTTTLPCNLDNVGTTGARRAAVMVLQEGSSTDSVLDIAIEHSRNGENWFRDTSNFFATNTPSLTLTNPLTYRLQFSSSTVGGAAGTATGTTRVFWTETPYPWVRAVFTVPIIGNVAGTATTTNSMLWAEIRGIE